MQVTAEDVVRNLENEVELLPGLVRPARSELGGINGLEILDELTLKVYLTEPYPRFLESMTGVAGMIASPETVDESGMYTGAGPYRLVGLSGDEYELERFADYWGPEAPPHRVVYRVARNEETRHAMLESGDLDILVGHDPDLHAAHEDNPEIAMCGDPEAYIAWRVGELELICFPDLALRLEYACVQEGEEDVLVIGIPEM